MQPLGRIDPKCDEYGARITSRINQFVIKFQTTDFTITGWVEGWRGCAGRLHRSSVEQRNGAAPFN